MKNLARLLLLRGAVLGMVLIAMGIFAPSAGAAQILYCDDDLWKYETCYQSPTPDMYKLKGEMSAYPGTLYLTASIPPPGGETIAICQGPVEAECSFPDGYYEATAFHTADTQTDTAHVTAWYFTH